MNLGQCGDELGTRAVGRGARAGAYGGVHAGRAHGRRWTDGGAGRRETNGDSSLGEKDSVTLGATRGDMLM
jgi:hypothetical protein